jgi:hypothetical protein
LAIVKFKTDYGKVRTHLKCSNLYRVFHNGPQQVSSTSNSVIASAIYLAKALCKICHLVCLGFLYVIIGLAHFSRSPSLTSSRQLLYSWPSITIKSITSPFKGQVHFMIILENRRNPYILNCSDQINSKLGVKVAYGLALS